MESLKFVADGMLGKLSRWLRMLGHDVEFSNDLDDSALVDIAKAEDRVLLTRDLELCRSATRQGVSAYLVEGGNPAERLAAVSRELKLELEFDPDKSRCPTCNARIEGVNKLEILSEIPPSTARTYDEFWKCSRCGKVYWQGSHWKRIARTLEKARILLREKGSYSSGASHARGTS